MGSEVKARLDLWGRPLRKIFAGPSQSLFATRDGFETLNRQMAT